MKRIAKAGEHRQSFENACHVAWGDIHCTHKTRQETKRQERHTHAHTCTHTHTHARTNAHTHTRTLCNLLSHRPGFGTQVPLSVQVISVGPRGVYNSGQCKVAVPPMARLPTAITPVLGCVGNWQNSAVKHTQVKLSTHTEQRGCCEWVVLHKRSKHGILANCCKRIHERDSNPAPLSFRDSALPIRLPGITHTHGVHAASGKIGRAGKGVHTLIRGRRKSFLSSLKRTSFISFISYSDPLPSL